MDNRPDINLFDCEVIDGERYGLGVDDIQELGLPKGFVKKHEIIARETVQCVDTTSGTFYGYLNQSQCPRFGKFIELEYMFGLKTQVNIDTIKRICDAQAVLVRWDITGYDNIWPEIKGLKKAYKYSWYHFSLTTNVGICNKGDKIRSTVFTEELRKREIESVLDYEGKSDPVKI